MEVITPVARLNCNEELKFTDVLKYFKKNTNLKPTYPPRNAKGGEVYLYLIQNDISKDDWKVDGYRWYQNGTKLIPNSDPKFRKIYFSIVLPSGRDLRFKRHAYFLMDSTRNNQVLIHYIGDESVAINFPHGHSKSENRIFHRTCPSVLTKLASVPDLPANVYKNSISSSACAPEFQSSHLPRNSRQVINLQQKERQKSRLTHDALYNLHELAYDLGDFVKMIKTFPDLVIVCGFDTVLKELELVLQAQFESTQLLSYDTTFQLGDFYLSLLLFRHTLFSPSPVIPSLFLIHERKFQACHEEFMQQLARSVPSLVTGKHKVPLVTDDEVGIHRAIDKHLPNVLRLRCWNHTINAVKLWLKKHGASHAEIPAYVSHVRDLLNESSYASYEQRLKVFKMKWSQAFVQYFMSEIHPELPVTLGRFVLEPMNLYHPFTGITNNQSESFNVTLKRLQRWRVPVDCILLALYHLQAYFHNEIQRGFAGLGNYQLSSKFSTAARTKDELSIITCYSPQDIVDRIKRKMITGDNSSEKSPSQIILQEEKDTENGEHLITQFSRARSIIENNLISHNQSLGFPTTGKPHAIRLFPKESCTCPSTSRCYHILAVRMSIGLEDVDSKQKVSLSQLRRNTRSRGDKKSGRKAPRAGDYDIVPAPDSSASTKQSKDGAEQSFPVNPKAFEDKNENEDTSNPANQTSTSIKEQETQIHEKFDPPSQRYSGKKRKRCGTCNSCTTSDCGECRYCKDKPKFGGRGLLRQCCVKRKCKRMRLDSEGDHKTDEIITEEKTNDQKKEFSQIMEEKENVADSKPKDVLICSINNCQVYDSNLKTLGDTNWLDDKIIDYYMFLLMREANSERLNSVFCVSCFFYQKLCESGYHSIANWIKVNVLTYQKFIVPINRGAHWCLAIVDTTMQELRYYDSIYGEYIRCLETIRNYLSKANPNVDFSSWKMLCPKDIPKQTNGYDCGVFTCMYARYQAFNRPFSFSQEHIKNIRKRMILELKEQSLIEQLI